MDILVSFGVVSLFTRVPLEGTLQILQQEFHKQTVNLMKHVPRTTYFLYDGSFFKQNDRVAIASPLAPVVVNFTTEHLKKTAIFTAINKPIHWYRYVDNTCVVWPHRKEALQGFLEHLKCMHHTSSSQWI
jgi:hypothetical protein